MMATAQTVKETKAQELPPALDAEEKETTYTFMDKISCAQLNGDRGIETSDKIIHHYNRKGLGHNVEHFIYGGIVVTRYGRLQAVLDQLDREENKHGDKTSWIGRK